MFKETREYRDLLTLVGTEATGPGSLQQKILNRYRAVCSAIESLTKQGERNAAQKEGAVLPKYNHGLMWRLGHVLMRLTTIVCDISNDRLDDTLAKEHTLEALDSMRIALENIMTFAVTEGHFEKMKIDEETFKAFLEATEQQYRNVLTLKENISRLNFEQPARTTATSTAQAMQFWREQEIQMSNQSSHQTVSTVKVTSGSV